ncbi:MAG: methionine biosynthesis protein MetW [Cellvibrionaceae bacterium]|nr:methionine biosynthesis protein MetW [Cellvibrionaceae bacterium]
MRVDFDLIQKFVPNNAHVLDLACGDGALLAQLRDELQIQGVGLEIDVEKITECIEKNIAVVEKDLNTSLAEFDDNSYDVVIMTLALQAMNRPDLVLEEMLRIGRQCVVTFPNFGHWKARWHLALHGRMPVSDLLPYQWYDTPNIHFCTVKDFELLCQQRQIKILHRDMVVESSWGAGLVKCHPNLFSETAVYHLSK